MDAVIHSVRGMNDVLPPESARWRFLETTLFKLAESYGYREIRTPILERTSLFLRSIGEVTDIVEKEMYSFTDRQNESLTLRPENTASCVRAGVEHGLLYHQIQRFFYNGPMFRHERPQKGRYRQFHQFGMEAFGMDDPAIDAELMFFSSQLWKLLGLDGVELHLNSIGQPESREQYRKALCAYLSNYYDDLDQDSQKRLTTNPLRILDSKNPKTQDILNQAPMLSAFLDPESVSHLNQVKDYLHASQVPFIENQKLVRGLDYYNRTVFEWQWASSEGAQNTLCAGGRYDGLVEQLGGSSVPAVGMAIGIERVLMYAAAVSEIQPATYYVISATPELRRQAFECVQRWRALRELHFIFDAGSSGLKTQLKRADKSTAQWAVLFAEEEWSVGKLILKSLRANEPQRQMTEAEFFEMIRPS